MHWQIQEKDDKIEELNRQLKLSTADKAAQVLRALPDMPAAYSGAELAGAASG